MPPNILWLTTQPNPRTRCNTADAGQRGWRTHAVLGEPTALFTELRFRRSLCGLLPRHGWGIDLFIDEECARCHEAAFKLDPSLYIVV